nr:hypothetical protein [Ottowia beijingensis]
MTLIELMVGIALGLMVVAVATVALMSSRSVSGTISDASTMQQQASYAFSVIGRQVRQAGSVELNLNPNLSFTVVTALLQRCSRWHLMRLTPKACVLLSTGESAHFPEPRDPRSPSVTKTTPKRSNPRAA